MFEIKRYTPEQADEWNQFVAASKNGTFLFDRRYMDYHADRFEGTDLKPSHARCVSSVCRHPGISQDGLARHLCIDKSQVARQCAYLEEKGIQADFSRSFAYGDSKGDLPMLNLCGHPVQANPKKGLRRAAPHMPSVSWQENPSFRRM